MGFINAAELQQRRTRMQGMGEAHVATPTFSEANSLAYQETQANELFTSKVNMENTFLDPVKKELLALKNDGSISPQEWGVFAKQTRRGPRTDWEGLANFSNDSLGTDFDVSEETMHAQHRAATEARQIKLNKVQGMGNAGAFLGSMGAMMTDPVQVATLLTPMAPIKFGATTIGTIAKMAFREGMVNVGIESVVQLQVSQFKKEVGLQYHMSEGAVNLLAAFVFGAAIGGGRMGARLLDGDASLAHAIEANSVIISEMDARVGPMSPLDTMIYDDLKLTQAYIEELGKTPGNLNMSARDAYQVAWKQFENMNLASMAPSSADNTEANAHVDFVGPHRPGVIPTTEAGKLPVAMESDDLPLAGFSPEAGMSIADAVGAARVIAPGPAPDPVMLQTRGLGVQYHGTSTELIGAAALSDESYGSLNYYGQGLYTTDATDVAQGYMKKGKGTSPTMYQVDRVAGDIRMLDMEQPLTPEIEELLRNSSETMDEIIDQFPNMNLRELYDERRQWDGFESADEVQVDFDSIAYNLGEAGYDGLRHEGGGRTGTAPHNVEIHFNPTKTAVITKMEGPPMETPPPRASAIPDPDTPPRTLGELRAQLQAELDANTKNYDNFIGCMSG